MPEIKVIVAATNANGEPDFFGCVVRCSQVAIDEGTHYEIAIAKAEANGFEKPAVAFDEEDTAFRCIQADFLPWIKE